jgi:hypothetical protein
LTRRAQQQCNPSTSVSAVEQLGHDAPQALDDLLRNVLPGKHGGTTRGRAAHVPDRPSGRDGADHPATVASLLVAAIILLGGPLLLATARERAARSTAPR